MLLLLVGLLIKLRKQAATTVQPKSNLARQQFHEPQKG
jgi:hypothetical protein